MKRIPNLRGLLTFDAVARHQSFSRAGRELQITQGAVSHRIRTLEDEIGLTLLTRSSRRVRLTEPGRALFRATEEAFGRLREGMTEMRTVSHSRRVTVSCSPSFAIRWLVPHLAELRAEIPDIELHISADDELIEPGTSAIDVCIRFGGGVYDGVDSEQLTWEAVEPVCSPYYAERLKLRKLEDIRRCELLHDDVLVGHVAHVGWSDWAEAAKLKDVDVEQGLRFSHSHMALDAAMAGQGLALARRSLVRQDLALGRLLCPFDFELPSHLTYWLITPSGSPLSPSTSAFRDWLRKTLSPACA